MHRRKFVYISALMASMSRFLPGCKTDKLIQGKIIGASAALGHMVRDKVFKEPTEISKRQVVIIGGGISGLSAARHLQKNGITDFALLDLEENMGGNSRYGGNSISAYPWGAHYIPTPNNDLTEYLDFLKDCGVISATSEDGSPVYNEYYLCFDPQERLYINGRWQDGVVPQFGIEENDQNEIQRFFKLMQRFRERKGEDGKDAFAIPADNSSKDDALKKLDTITMQQWLVKNDFKSPYLHWYVNYCTRDDYGTTSDIASAWIGIHYFASRKGKGTNAEQHDLLTWPEGNGWLSKQLQKEITKQIHNQCLGLRVEQKEGGVRIVYFDAKNNTLKAIDSAQCIMAIPQFICARLLQDENRIAKVHQHFHYTPWMVANLRVKNLEERSGASLSWDNVLYESSSLGYINAIHELLPQKPSGSNLTYYLPLTAGTPSEERKKAMHRTHADWCEIVLSDLQKVHPNIRKVTEELNVMIWGHAMVQPLPGLIHGTVRNDLAESLQNVIHFAHTDLAGNSIFEEAFYQGIGAAKKVIKELS